MSKLTLLLALAAPLACHAQLCEPSPQVRDALKDATRKNIESADRSAAVRTVLQEFPNDLWAHRA